jgi:hypothetical protein
MPSSSSSLNTKIKEKLSPEEAVQLVELLGREIPIAQYVKFVNERTGEEMDINEVIKQQQPKQSSCYDYFLDYMNCHVRLVVFFCVSMLYNSTDSFRVLHHHICIVS